MRAATVIALSVCIGCASNRASPSSADSDTSFGMYCSGTMFKPCHPDQQACEQADATECLWINDLWCHAEGGQLRCFTSDDECADFGAVCHHRAPM